MTFSLRERFNIWWALRCQDASAPRDDRFSWEKDASKALPFRKEGPPIRLRKDVPKPKRRLRDCFRLVTDCEGCNAAGSGVHCHECGSINSHSTGCSKLAMDKKRQEAARKAAAGKTYGICPLCSCPRDRHARECLWSLPQCKECTAYISSTAAHEQHFPHCSKNRLHKTTMDEATEIWQQAKALQAEVAKARLAIQHSQRGLDELAALKEEDDAEYIKIKNGAGETVVRHRIPAARSIVTGEPLDLSELRWDKENERFVTKGGMVVAAPVEPAWLRS